MLNLGQAKKQGGEKMRTTVRFVADIPPEVKKKFQKVALENETTMKDMLVEFVEKEYKKTFGKQK